jgi:peptidoglycan hydrolase CwlO-like protein
LENLKADELVQMMQLFLSKGVAACQKGFERVTNEAKASLAEKKLLEDENHKLHEENERLKDQSRQLKEQSAKQQTAIGALKQDTLNGYEKCHTELKDMDTQYDAQQRMRILLLN